MRNIEKDMIEMKRKREKILESAFRLFSDTSIDAVSMNTVAAASEIGVATIYRYFKNKPDLVTEVAVTRWEMFAQEYIDRRNKTDFSGMTAAEEFETDLNEFILLYRNHKDLLRFNQFFNIYAGSGHMGKGRMQAYLERTSIYNEFFHRVYVKAQKDGTLRTDLPEDKFFALVLHLMMAAVTRYAGGLVYLPADVQDPEPELVMLKNMILNTFRTERGKD